MSDTKERRIVVEVVAHADVQRLDGRIDELVKENAALKGRIEGLHRMIFELIDKLSDRSK